MFYIPEHPEILCKYNVFHNIRGTLQFSVFFLP